MKYKQKSKRKTPKPVRLGDLEPGTVFQYEDCPELWMVCRVLDGDWVGDQYFVNLYGPFSEFKGELCEPDDPKNSGLESDDMVIVANVKLVHYV